MVFALAGSRHVPVPRDEIGNSHDPPPSLDGGGRDPDERGLRPLALLELSKRAALTRPVSARSPAACCCSRSGFDAASMPRALRARGRWSEDRLSSVPRELVHGPQG